MLKMQSGGLEVQALQNRPTLNKWVTEYWEAFQILSGSRMMHQAGIGPIPLTEYVAYMQATCMTDVDERLKFIRMVQALDNVYVTHINTNAKRKTDAARNKAKK